MSNFCGNAWGKIDLDIQRYTCIDLYIKMD